MRAELMEKKLQENKGRGVAKSSQIELELKEKKMRELEKAEREGDKNGFNALKVSTRAYLDSQWLNDLLISVVKQRTQTGPLKCILSLMFIGIHFGLHSTQK